MKAMLIDRFGPSSEFRLGEIDAPAPAAGQVLIRAAYASVNPADWKCRAGLLPVLAGTRFPLIVGMDCSGVVEAVGEAVSRFKPGDKVISLSALGAGAQGTYAEYSVAPAQRVFPVPAGLNLEQAATIPIAAASAASSILDVAKVKAGDLVLVNGGSGSVGIFAIQFLRHLGARVAATCSTRNLEFVQELGAERVIDYTREAIPAALVAWAPDGVDVVIDAVGQHSLPADIAANIRPGGVLVCITNLLTGIDAFDLELARSRDVRVLDNVRAAMSPDPSDFQVSALRQLLQAVDTGEVKPPPYEVLDLADAAAAQDRVQDGHVRGKLLLKIAELGHA
jgi:NADPH2:quinone reductase